MRRPLVRILAGVTVTLGATVVLGAQNTTHLGARVGAAPMHESDSNGDVSPLQRLVTLDLRKVTLDEALAEIDRQANLGLSYSPRTVPVDRIVTVRVTQVSARRALDVALDGTDVRVTVSATGQIVLTRDQVAADSVTGSVTGTVIETATKSMITGATVQVMGTKIAQVTKSDGSYRLTGIAEGAHVLRVTRLGYLPKDVNVFVREGKATATQIELTPVPAKLNEVITTASGNQKRVEIGNSVATIQADSVVRNSPIQNLSDLLAGRAPGVQVMTTSGSVGAGSRVRIRGVGGVGNSDPILIVDGVRMDANYSDYTGAAGADTKQFNRAAPAGGVTRAAASSRLDDIDPNSIESIEVLKGPSAATLYGSDAANGVIVIKTKHGEAGPARWSFTGQRGMMQMKAKFPETYHGFGTSPEYGAGATCTLADLADGNCTSIDSVTHFSPLNNSLTTPFGTGSNMNLGAQVSGGTPQMLYFFSGNVENEVGVLKMPQADVNLLLAQNHGASIPDYAMRPNTFGKQSGQSRFTSNFGSTGTLSLTTLATHQVQANVGDEAIVGAAESGSGNVNINDGWSAYGPRPSQIFGPQATSAETRGTVSLDGTYTPFAWLNGHGTIGADYGDRTDNYLALRGDSVYNVYPLGQGQRGRVEGTTTIYSLTVGGTATIPVNNALKMQTAIGMDGQHTYNKALAGQGTNIPAGGTTFNSAGTTTLSESFDQNITAGWYLQEMANINDRLFVTGGFRQDAASTFGKNVAPLYPKLSVSWLVSQEPFFPHLPAVSNLRFRTAYGHAGTQPSTTGALRTFTPGSAYLNGALVPVSTLNSLGNGNIKPQRGTELEIGGDLSLWDDKYTVEGTFYNKLAKDALISPQVPPSFGYPLVLPIQQNVGKVLNTGTEWSITGTPYTSEPLTWDFTVGLSANRNILKSLNKGVYLANNGTEVYAVGYPLSGLWARPILGYKDINGDGIISKGEVIVGDSAVFIGAPSPSREISVTNGVGFLNNRVRVSAMFDYQGGLGQQDQASANMAYTGARGAVDPKASLAEQAAVVAYSQYPNNTTWAYDASVSYTRLRELTFSFDLPARWARYFHAQSATFLVLGENLKIWANYTGADPEVNTNPIRNYFQDAGGMPLTRNWSIRLNLGL